MAAAPKTVRTTASVKLFIDSIPGETRRRDAQLVSRLMAKLSGERAAMWGPNIVGFGSRMILGAGGKGNTWPVIAFSPRKAALVLYLGRFPERDVLLAQLGKHKTTGGCTYIKNLDDVDVATLGKLVVGSIKKAYSAT